MFQQIGFGVAVALLLDATVVRSVLVPASMRLLGDWNWYLPRWLDWLPARARARAGLTCAALRRTLDGSTGALRRCPDWGCRMAEPKVADLVLEGAASRAWGSAAQYVAFREAGYTAANVAGTSAGAITAALIAANYPPEGASSR